MTDLTAPYRAEAAETVRQSHRQQVSGLLYLADSSNPLTIANLSGTVTFSEDWSPHVQMRLGGIAPVDPFTVGRIDPRKGSHVEIRAGYIYPGADDDVQLLARGMLQNRDVETPGNLLTIEANSEELRVQESKWVQATTTKSFAGVLEALQWLQGYATAPNAFRSTIGTGYRPDLVSAVVLEQGADIWSVMDSIALAAGLRVYVDDTGEWQVEPKVTVSGESSVFLTEGPGTIVRKVKDTLSRNGWYTAAVLTYTWKDGSGDHKIVGVYAPNGGAGEVGAGHKVFTENRTGPISQYDADLAAQTTIANLSTRGDAYEIDAVACYWLRDGATVQVRLANGTEARHIVRSVAFNLGAGTMTVTTREPSNLGK